MRQKIYDSVYWKQECFGLSAERLVDKAVELKYVGGMYGEPQKSSEFIALILKMLQIQPDKEIIVEFIKNDDFKYLRLLGEGTSAHAGWRVHRWLARRSLVLPLLLCPCIARLCRCYSCQQRH